MIDEVMAMIGSEIAKMHTADIVHSDLTTSNMMLRRPSASPSGSSSLVRIVIGLIPQDADRFSQFIIDFGLAYTSTLAEDKAVDLYVLERAFSSTHPDSAPLFARVLQAYEQRLGKGWPSVKKKLDEGMWRIISMFKSRTYGPCFSTTSRPEA